jgi:hypothetical protein
MPAAVHFLGPAEDVWVNESVDEIERLLFAESAFIQLTRNDGLPIRVNRAAIAYLEPLPADI